MATTYEDLYKRFPMRDPRELNKPIDVVSIDEKKVYYKQPTNEELKKNNTILEDKRTKEKTRRIREEKEEKDKKDKEEKEKKDKEEKDKKERDKKLEDLKIKREAIKKKTEAAEALDPAAKAIVDPAKKAIVDPALKKAIVDPSKKDDPNAINFFWVRHAESVANLYNNKPTDKYPNDLNASLKDELRNFLEKEYDNVQGMKGGATAAATATAPLPLVKEVYEVIATKAKEAETVDTTKYDKEYKEICKSLADKTYLKERFPFDDGDENKYTNKKGEKKAIDPNNSKCIGTLGEDEELTKNDADKTKKSQFYALWLQNFTTTNFLFQPTLSQCGMIQARILGEQIQKNKLITGDDIIVITSASVRTMMTAYLTLLYAGDTIKEKTIYVVPYLTEAENDAKHVFFGTDYHDYCNYGIAPAKIEAVGTKILDWFAANKIYTKDGNTAEVIMKNNGITFDYSLYKIPTDDVRKADITKFLTFVGTTTIITSKKNVLAFSHGYAVKEVREKAFTNNNTSIKEKIELDAGKTLNTWGSNSSMFQHKYIKDVKDVKDNNIQPIFGNTIPNIKKETNPTPADLAKFGLTYYPNDNTTVRTKATALLKMDETIADNNKLTSLDKDCLRGDIARITHADGGVVAKAAVVAPVTVVKAAPATVTDTATPNPLITRDFAYIKAEKKNLLMEVRNQYVIIEDKLKNIPDINGVKKITAFENFNSLIKRILSNIKLIELKKINEYTTEEQLMNGLIDDSKQKTIDKHINKLNEFDKTLDSYFENLNKTTTPLGAIKTDDNKITELRENLNALREIIVSGSSPTSSRGGSNTRRRRGRHTKKNKNKKKKKTQKRKKGKRTRKYIYV